MTTMETIKKTVETLTGWSKPSKSELAALVRQRKVHTFRFKDDSIIPNHPRWPLVIYRGAVRFLDEFDPAAVLEEVFTSNGWGHSWRGGIYDYVHYHSRIHEVLGVARGKVQVRLGGNRGRTLTLKTGDVAILPAGTGHQCLGAADNFLAVGAYPPSGKYDECTTSEEHKRAVKTIPKVGRPRKDPVFGGKGPLLKVWNAAR